MLLQTIIAAVNTIAAKRMMRSQDHELIIILTQHFSKRKNKFAFGLAIAIRFDIGFFVFVQPPLAVEYDHHHIVADLYFFGTGATIARFKGNILITQLVYITLLAHD